jgi:hypothetical protein
MLPGITPVIAGLFTTPAAAGSDLLIVMLSHRDTGNGAASWPSGWTVLYSITNSNMVGEIAYKVDDGTTGGTINVTTVASVQSAHCSYRIRGRTGNPEQANNAPASTSANMDPPSLSPSWGADNTLWLACAAWNQDNNLNDPTYPANYSNGFAYHSNNNQASMASCQRALNAASEDPAALVYTSNRRYVAATVGIRPDGGSAPSVNNSGGGVTSTAGTTHTLTIPASV